MAKSILIIGNYPPPFGGVPRHIEYLAPFLVKRGWKVHILSGGSTGTENKEGFTVYKPTKEEKLKAIAEFFLTGWWTRKKIRRAVKKENLKETLATMAHVVIGAKLIREYDINLISAYNLYTYAPVGAVLSERYGVPLVVTNFGEIFDRAEYFEKNRDVVNYICSTASRLLAMSRHCAQSYSRIGLSPEVEVIPYGVDIRRFNPQNDGSIIRKRLGIGETDGVVLFVGRLVRDMGVDVLTEAIPSVLGSTEDVRFIIVGEKGECLDELLRLTEHHRGRVFVEPSVSFEELPLYYAASTVAVAPTTGERACGSLAAIEAMATGRAVVASRVGGIPEIVEEGVTGLLVPPQDATALAEALIRLLGDRTLTDTMGKRGRERAERLFDEDKTDSTLESLFNRVAGL